MNITKRRLTSFKNEINTAEMSTETLDHFRNFITESFTAVAVNIFTEVQALVQAYDSENKRLRTLLDSVLNPEIRLSRIDVRGYTASRRPAVREARPGVNSVATEPQYEEIKEEPMDYVITEGSNEVTVVVKDEPGLPPISDSYIETEVSFASSATASVEDGDNRDEEQDSTEEEAESREVNAGVANKKTARQKTMLETPRFKKPNKTFLSTPNEYQTFISRLTEAFQHTPEEQRPLLTRLGLDKDCALREVPKGSPLTDQYPLATEYRLKPLDDAPPQPGLPLQSQTLDTVVSIPTLSADEQTALSLMKLTWPVAYNLEFSTRTDRELISLVKNKRLTDCFTDVVCLKAGQSNTEHLIGKLKSGSCRSTRASEEELRVEALRQYCRLLCVNWYPCGLVVNPGVPWLAAQPDGIVYDPNEAASFGLTHVKCPSARSFTECSVLACKTGVLQLKSNSPRYWHIQGQMMVTGTSWCDLLLFCEEDMLVQRIYRDEEVIKTLKRKMDEFFFCHYLPSLFQG